jgi:hypothetical protein
MVRHSMARCSSAARSSSILRLGLARRPQPHVELCNRRVVIADQRGDRVGRDAGRDRGDQPGDLYLQPVTLGREVCRLVGLPGVHEGQQFFDERGAEGFAFD